MARDSDLPYLSLPVGKPARGGVLLGCAAALASGGAWPMEIVAVETDRNGSAYLIRVEAILEATPQQLMATLTDYDRIHELHPKIRASRSLGQVEPATTEVYTRIEGCMLLYCQTIHKVERIRATGTELFGEVVPHRGSFLEGRSHYRFEADGQGTRLLFEARFVPAFWVPPLLAGNMLARSIAQTTVETLAEVERLGGERDD